MELDPRWEWVDVSTLGEGPGARFVKSRCNHLEMEPITDVTGERVAVLCRTCDVAWDLEGQPLSRGRRPS
jgi:hypothetical protein